MLVNEVELRGGVQLARHDRVIEVGDEVRIGNVAERRNAVLAEADEIDEAGAVLARRALQQAAEASLELLADLASLIGWQARERLGHEALPQALVGLMCFVRHGSNPLS